MIKIRKGNTREFNLNILRRELEKIKPIRFGFDIEKWVRLTLKCSQLTAKQYLNDLKDYGDLN